MALLLFGSVGSGLAQPVDRWRILAVRVSFPPEEADNETTSGTGSFDILPFDSTREGFVFPFDAPPHDRAYFEAHLQALSNYYREVSGGRLEIEYEVYPRDDTGSYLLHRPLIEYGNGRTRSEINGRITQLFRDGIAAADSVEGGALDFSEFRAFIVFHAGIGGEASQALNDVPSAYIFPEDLERYADGPISVNKGAQRVTNGILLPEAISKDGRGGLNAAVARFFANQLGLPTLSDRENDLPAVGRWSLLDSGDKIPFSAQDLDLPFLGSGVENPTLLGYIPSRMLAWSRIHLGWITPLTIIRSDTVRIVAPHVRSDLPQAVKVPISATEYFLLENRMSRLQVEDRPPEITFSRGGAGGVWLSVDDYDAFIPGSGILIWHVDETVIARTGTDAHINSNPAYEIAFAQYRRGISLEEADGLEDIGNVSASRVVQDGIISFASIEGGPEDPFYVGNREVLGPDTTPNTRSNLGYASGVTIEVLSEPGDTMTVAVRFEERRDVWPVTGLDAGSTAAPRSVDLDGDGTRVILRPNSPEGDAGASTYRISGVPLDSPKFSSRWAPAVGNLITQDGLTEAFIFGDADTRSLWNGAVRSEALDPDAGLLSTSPVIARFPSNLPADIWGREGGRVEWGRFAGPSGWVDLGEPIEGLAVGNFAGDAGNELVALTRPGGVYLIDTFGRSELLATVSDAFTGPPAAADLDRDGLDELVFVTRSGICHVLSGTGKITRSDPVPGGAASSPALGDLNNDGFVEILFGGSGRIWSVGFNGVNQADTPIALPLKDQSGPLTATPLLADLDNDGDLEILAASPGGLLYGLDLRGRHLPGFPLSAPGPIEGTPLLDDLDEDGTLELVYFTTSGSAHLHHLEELDASFTGSRIAWGQQGGGPTNEGHLLLLPTATPSPLPLAELLPEGRIYCHPNPIRDPVARIRFFLGESARVDVLILNAIGEEVDRLSHGSPVPGVDNEIEWDTTGYASGLYICRVEAIAPSRSEVRFLKAAVIR